MSEPFHPAGMDHEHYAWSPLPQRALLRWPDGRPLALAVLILVEHIELYPPENTVQVPLPTGNMMGMWSFPHMPILAQREYGHRVGIFRLLEMLKGLGIPPTIVIDAMAAERYPELVRQCAASGAEFVGHGISASQVITSAMPAVEERAYIHEALKRIEAATGAQIRGWMSPDQTQSLRTPQLLDEAGVDYVLDWPNDEQPYYMTTPHHMVSLPTAYELDDSVQTNIRGITPDLYANSIVHACAQLVKDGETTARSLVLTLRPSVTGHSLRIGLIEEALRRVMNDGRIWGATAGAIVKAFREQRRS